jgi:hypothetical protein
MLHSHPQAATFLSAQGGILAYSGNLKENPSASRKQKNGTQKQKSTQGFTPIFCFQSAGSEDPRHPASFCQRLVAARLSATSIAAKSLSKGLAAEVQASLGRKET